MKALPMFVVVAACVAASAASAQLTAPGGAQRGMRADGEGQSAVPFLRAVRPAESGPTVRRADPTGPTVEAADGRATAPGATDADRGLPGRAGLSGRVRPGNAAVPPPSAGPK